MKIAIIGYSGSGKSTLAKTLGECCHCPVLYLDKVHWLPGWEERDLTDALTIVEDCMGQESWVIDGNYSAYHQDRRLEEADQILFLNFPRLYCLFQVVRRYLQNRSQTRESMTPGCEEKLDWEFIRWVLWDARTPEHKAKYRRILEQYPNKTIEFHSRGQVRRFLKCLQPPISLK